MRPRLTDILDVLQLEIGTYSQVYILVDALDEYPEGDRHELVSTLRSLGNVNLMVTSRPLLSIKDQFDGAKHLRISAMDDDVRKYIKDRIVRETRLARLVQNLNAADLQDTIVNKIVRNVGGMYASRLHCSSCNIFLTSFYRFLLAKLHIDSLISKTNLRAVRVALEHLLTGINATYDEAMVRIQRQNVDDRMLAKRVLKWVACALRPLTKEELRHALAVTPEMTDMDFEALVDEITLIEVCAGLVIIDGNQSRFSCG